MVLPDWRGPTNATAGYNFRRCCISDFAFRATIMQNRILFLFCNFKTFSHISSFPNKHLCAVRSFLLTATEYDFDNAQQGAIVTLPKGKTRITIRIDTDILDWFRNQVHKAGGGNYQTLINEALREYIQQVSGTLEGKIRKVIREELKVITK